MLTSQLTSKGQTTIPAAVRKALGLSAADRLVYEIHDGRVVIRPLKGNLLQLKGSVKAREHPEDFAAIRDSVKQVRSRQRAGTPRR